MVDCVVFEGRKCGDLEGRVPTLFSKRGEESRWEGSLNGMAFFEM